jgi:hypothetical protein
MSSDDNSLNESSGAIDIKTLLAFLAGRRADILKIAASRGSRKRGQAEKGDKAEKGDTHLFSLEQKKGTLIFSR